METKNNRVEAKKHLGQHFLKNLSIAEEIADAVGTDDTVKILEIGPGMGVLTQFLSQKYPKVIAVDIDQESIAYLQQHFTHSTNLTIQHGDFLKLNFAEISNQKLAIVGNFPYNISTQILFKILENRSQVPISVGMFQKEVAERVVSKEGSKIYGILSVLVQAYYHAEYLFTVSENEFFPPPKVKSAVIKLTQYRESIGNDKLLFQLVKAGFNQRRKKLSNALKSIGIPEKLQSHPFMDKRSEQLSVEDFITLTELFS